MPRKRTIEELIKKANEIHGNKYDYSLIKEYNTNVKIDIICKIHGVFNMIAKHHISGSKSGCPKCSSISYVEKRKMGNEEFSKRANKLHNFLYDYSQVDYKTRHLKIKIICKIHGVFEQRPKDHLFGNGCPSCSLDNLKSKGEEAIALWLKKNKIDFYRQKRFDDCKNKNSLPFDFYIQSKNMIIEYDGKQHFFTQTFSKNNEELIERKRIDKIKTDFCRKKRIKFLRIPYFHYNKINEILSEAVIL